MTTAELLTYYANLLILQYRGKPKAYATVKALANLAVMGQLPNAIQTLILSSVPASGAFTLQFGATNTASIAWNATNATIQSDLNTAIQIEFGLSASVNPVLSVAGSLASKNLVITLASVEGIPLLLLSANTLQNSVPAAVSIVIATSSDDGVLPILVQNAFTLGTAVGAQLDTIGKYVGVKRSGYTFSGPVVLDDTDFTQLIKIAIIQNASGSSLADIQNLISVFFPGVIRVFDYADMSMDYFFDSSIGSNILAEFFVKGHFLPKPMGVQLGTLVYASPIDNFFGWRTMVLPPYKVHGFNTMAVYDTGCPWLKMANGISP